MDKDIKEFMETIIRNTSKMKLEIVEINSEMEPEVSSNKQEISKDDASN